MNNKRFNEKLIDWYNISKRDLPWRDTQDPYKIWLSEVILQQTRVAQGLPFYYKFIDHYETVEALAAAEEEQVLRLWQGLGYYSRARNLHRCAKLVTEELGGTFPSQYKNLLKLPGVGKYTAAAIASFAFGEKVPVIDGNVYRVLSRVFGIHDDIADGKGQKVFEEWACQTIPEEQSDTYNQAIMEFGATHCTPKVPQCESCIFNIECLARKQNLQNQLPVKTNKVKVRNRYFHYIVLRINQKTAMKKREDNDIWKGLYDYMMIEAQEFKSANWIMDHEAVKILQPFVKNMKISEDYKHVLTHQRLYARFYTFYLEAKEPLDNILNELQLSLLDETAVYQVPKPVLVSRYLNDTIF